jgi:hypothetical protein
MNRENAINYLRSSGFSEEQITEIEHAFKCDPCEDAIHNEREQAYMRGYEDACRKYRTEPCEDAISRRGVLDEIIKEIKGITPTYHNPDWSITDLVSMSKVIEVFEKYKVEIKPQESEGQGMTTYELYFDQDLKRDDFLEMESEE